MKIRIRRPRSCLGWFLWLLGILLSLVLLNNVYARAHVFAAQAGAYKLARELGYTPADFLRSEMYQADDDMFTVSSVCEEKVVFVTPLELPTFEARLLAVQPGTSPIYPLIIDGRNFYSELLLNVYDVSGRQTFPRLPAKFWFLARETPAVQTTVVEWYQTSQVPARITFGEPR